MPAFGLVRPGEAIPAADRVDEARIALTQLVVAEPEPFHRPGTKVVDEHVGAAHQAQDDVEPGGLSEVHRQRAFVPVGGEEDVAHAVRPRQRGTRVVAAPRPLDLDDVGAEVAEHLRRKRAERDLREVEHAHAVERQHRGAHRPLHRGARFSRNARTPSSPSSEASA